MALGWIFSSSVFLNNSVKVVSHAFDLEKDQSVAEESSVSRIPTYKYVRFITIGDILDDRIDHRFYIQIKFRILFLV